MSPTPRPTLALQALRGCPPLRVLGWLSLPFYPLFCLFVMDHMNYGASLDALTAFWKNHPGPAIFETLVVLYLFAALTLLLRRAWTATLIFGCVSLMFAFVNYTKVALNGDHFYPQDLAMVTQAGALSSFLSGELPESFFSFIAVAAVWTAALWLLDIALPRRTPLRLGAAAVLLAAGYAIASHPGRSTALLSHFSMSPMDAALQSSNYSANGFVGAFTINALSMQLRAPEGYSTQTIDALLSPYSAVPVDPEKDRFDVVVVLSESFFDPRTLPGVSFSENPLPNYDRLLDSGNSYSGMIYTTAVGGGTVRPEFSVLTGLTTDYISAATPYWYVDSPVSGYVSNYKDAGYTAIAVHPYDKKFYSRDTAYPHLGFDAFYGAEDIQAMGGAGYKRGYISDETTFQAIQTLMDAQDGPTFLFAITMQNHQPFNALPEEEIRIRVDAPTLSQPSLTALTTYAQGLSDADEMLGILASWIDQRERPTVLVFFGDHLPTLGSNHLAYNETGFVDTRDGFTSQELQKLHSTPFLIYANRPLGGGLLSQRTGNQISDYNLLNTLARSTGMARTPYMELLADFYRHTPFYNIRLSLTKDDTATAFAWAMELITYDQVLGEGWSG